MRPVRCSAVLAMLIGANALTACADHPAGLPMRLRLTALPTSTAGPESPAAVRTPSRTPRSATATPDDDIARLVREMPAEPTTVEVTGYVHVLGRPSRQELWQLLPDGRITLNPWRGGCPTASKGLRLYDRPVPLELQFGSYHENRRPDTKDWLAIGAIDVGTPSALLPSRALGDIGLPEQGRFRVRLAGSEAYASMRKTCPEVDQVVELEKVIEDLGTWRFYEGASAPFSYPWLLVMPPGWVAYHEATLGMTLRLPETWKIEARTDGLALKAPDWPEQPLAMTVYSASAFDAMATADAGPPLQPWVETSELDAPRLDGNGRSVSPPPRTMRRQFCAPPDITNRQGRTFHSLAAGCMAVALTSPGAERVLVFRQSYGRGDQADPRILFLFGEVLRRVELDAGPAATSAVGQAAPRARSTSLARP